MWIAAEKKLGWDEGGNQKLYIMYRLAETDGWTALSENIKGFEYEEGYEYVLLVHITPIKHPLQDASGVRYTLVKTVSKTDKSKDMCYLL